MATVKFNLHIKDAIKKTTLVVNLKGSEVFLLRRKLALICVWIAAKLLWTKLEIEG